MKCLACGGPLRQVPNIDAWSCLSCAALLSGEAVDASSYSHWRNAKSIVDLAREKDVEEKLDAAVERMKENSK